MAGLVPAIHDYKGRPKGCPFFNGSIPSKCCKCRVEGAKAPSPPDHQSFFVSDSLAVGTLRFTHPTQLAIADEVIE
jgi:hypothetical protein